MRESEREEDGDEMVALGKGRRGREGEKWFTAQGIGTRKLRAGSGMSEEERKKEEEGEGCKEEEKEGLRHRSRQEAGELELPSRRGRKRERGREERWWNGGNVAKKGSKVPRRGRLGSNDAERAR